MIRECLINPRVGWRYIDSEIVAFNCENQQIVIWNETASLLWEKIAAGMDFNDLIEFLTNKYSLSNKRAKRDIITFLQEANSCGFIDYNNKELKIENQNDKDGENILLTIEMKAIENLIPFAVTFETTYVCNEKCIHCYIDHNQLSLSLSEIRHILNEIAAAGCLFVSFTGGEFFTRNDAMEIVEYASKLHFVIDILSNGTLITKSIADKLALHPVRRVQISLYGATPETHDLITNLTGSFKNTLNGINFLTKAGIKVEIAFPLMGINFHERHLVKNLARSLGCLLSPSHVITARNNGKRDTFQLRLNDEQLKLFLEDKELSALYAGRKPFQDHQFYFKFSDLADAAPCYSGFNSCAITPSGKVLPCNQLLYEIGDLKKNSFSKIWHNSPQIQYLRDLTISKLTKCSKCQLLTSCARCPGLALLEGGDLLELSPENCRISAINHSLKGGENYG
ncbi:MAG TPA: PqqD family peptide modification chaperone [bacterium]|nr:PqqD family peptide modification chaperone [bacterium]